MNSAFASEDFRTWASTVPHEVTADPLWRLSAYKLGSFLGNLAWDDANVLFRNGITRPTASQLYRAVWSAPANMAEGYSKISGRDRARIFEYALGSVREASVWYQAGRRVLSDDIVAHRTAMLSEIRRLLLVMIPSERKK